MATVSGFAPTSSTVSPVENLPIIDIQTHKRCIACVAPHAVHLWLAGPEASPLPTCSNDSGSHAHRKLAWHPSGDRIVCASDTHVLFYNVGTPEPYAAINITAACGSVSCVVADETAVLVGGGTEGLACNVALLSWSGEVLRALRLADGRLETLAPPSALKTPGGTRGPPGSRGPIPAMVKRSTAPEAAPPPTTPAKPATPASPRATPKQATAIVRSLCASDGSDGDGQLTVVAVVVTSKGGHVVSGQAMALRASRGLTTLLSSLTDPNPTLLPAAGAICAALSASGSRVAIGSEDGVVRLFNLQSPSTEAEESVGAVSASAASPAELSLLPWGYEALETGGVSCLSFAADGATLAVGFSRRGAALFGICGTLIAQWPVRSAGVALAGGMLTRGTGTIAWAPGDTHVLATAASSSSSRGGGGSSSVRRMSSSNGEGGEEEASGVCRLAVLREPAVPGCARAAGSASFLLLGDDCVRAARLEPSAVDCASEVEWRALNLPRSYLQRAWPLQLGSLSSNGSYVAVAGCRGVAVAPLATERWKFLGASAAQVAPFRALFVEWISDEALLVVGHSLPSTATDPRNAASIPADGSWSVDASSGQYDRSHEHTPKLVVLVMRADLREVLFRGELPPTECPAAPLWGCALRVDETPGQPSRRGRYGLPHASTIVLGLLDRLVCVHLTVPNLPDAADTTSSMRFHLAVGVSVPLPESDNSRLSSNKPSGLSAVYVRGPRHSDAYDVTDAPSSSNGSQDGPLGLCLEAIVPLTDGAVLIVTLPASGGPSEIRRLLPPGSAQRCWHAAAPLGSLWTLSADTGLTQWRTGDRAAAADENGELTDGMLIGPPPREVMPIAILPAVCAVIGAAYLPVPPATAPIGPRLHAHPFVHTHIRRLLVDGRTDAAKRLASGSFFRRCHCLELLLHEALIDAAKADARERRRSFGSANGNGNGAADADDDEGGSKGSGYLFVRVAMLVRDLGPPDWMRIVAGCARKTDADHWPRLFATCGQPSEICVRSLDAGELQCAAAMLLPLRAQSGAAACERGVGLVRAAAEAKGRTKLVRELDRFLERVGD